MKQNNFSRKKRQLKVLVQKLQHLYRYHRIEAGDQIDKLIRKIKFLAQELAAVLSYSMLRKILGAAAVLIGVSFSNKANAQIFAAPVSLPFGLEHTYHFAFPAFADLDGDGDQDLVVGELYGVLKYFQNTGTTASPNFAVPLVNPFSLVALPEVVIPAFADLDGDGDMDLLIGGFSSGANYYQNTGSISNPQFAAPLANPFGIISTYGINAPVFADLDGDGDFDLLVGDYYGTIQYSQNTGSISLPQFAAPLASPFGLDTTSLAFPALADLDCDGDMDVLVGEYDGTMQYFQNTGSALSPQFAPPQTNPFDLVSTEVYNFPAFADLDGDGDSDLLVGEYYGVLQYFENLKIVGIADFSQDFDLTLFPNPVSDMLNIESEEKIDKIEAFNTLGENVIKATNQVSQISLGHLSPGIYVVKVSSAAGTFTTKKIQKQ